MNQIPDAPYIREAERKGYPSDWSAELHYMDDDSLYTTYENYCGYDREDEEEDKTT